MARSPAQIAAFEKMLAARKAKSASVKPTAQGKPKVKRKVSNKPVRKVGSNVKQSVANIRRNLAAKSKNKTEVGFD